MKGEGDAVPPGVGAPILRGQGFGRRAFLNLLGVGALAWPQDLRRFAQEVQGGGSPSDEPFWAFVRGRFLIPSDRIYLNNGTLGPSPRVVVEAVAEHARRVAATFPPGVDWTDLKRAVGTFIGADPEGLVFPRNTTEAMTFAAQGLELGSGDEVLTTDHEHIGGLCPWQLVTARGGARLRTLALPVPASSGEELLSVILDSLSPDTRVLSLSHVTFTTGTVLPVERLAPICAERGIVLVVDGAHPPGMMRVDLATWAPDFYATSPHKWLLAPQGTGLLHMAPKWRQRLWPTLASGGWDDLDLGAQRFNHLGTFDESRLAGLLAAVEFQRALGRGRIESRVRYLRGRLEKGIRSLPGVFVATPGPEELKSGMISFSLERVDPLSLQGHLARVARIRTRVVGEYGYDWMRLSTHFYNLPGEIDRTLGLLEEVVRRGLPRP